MKLVNGFQPLTILARKLYHKCLKGPPAPNPQNDQAIRRQKPIGKMVKHTQTIRR